VWYVAVTLASFALASLAFALRARAAVEQETARSTETALERYREQLERGGTRALQSMFECSPEPRPALRLTDERDVELFQLSSDPGARQAVARAAPEGEPALPRHWQLARTEVSHKRQLSIALHDEHAERLWSELRETSYGIFFVGLVLTVVGAVVITRRALRPVTVLAQATKKIVESGDLALRVPVRHAQDELTQLTQLFNQMLAKNESLVRAMRDSLDNVAHDLRTPLTRLRAGAELALSEPTLEGQEREALIGVVEETDRVLSMLTTLTDIIEAEAGAMRLDRNREDLSRIMREAVELYEFVAKEAGVTVVTHLPGDLVIMADRRRMSQVCANLIDNAIKYTPAGGRVEVTGLADRSQAVLRVADTGVGIAPEDLDRVWQRLFRADPSRGQHGLGLGLSLVKAVVEAHGGEVAVESRQGVGSQFEVRLPLAAPTGERAPEG
jgi:signal transduction histidine kinase